MATSETFFLKNDEKICLAVPFLFLPFVIFDLVHNIFSTEYMRMLGINLVELGLGPAGHVGLTWGFLFLFPEGRQWIKAKGYKFGGWHFLAISAGVFVVTSLIICIPDNRNNFFLKCFYLLEWFLITHHTIQQVKGLTIAYNFQQNPEPEHRSLINTVHARQRIAFDLLTAIAVLQGVHFFFDVDFLSSLRDKLIFAILATVLAASIIASNFRLPRGGRRQALFLLRLLYIPLGAFSFVAGLVYRVLHGTEYIFIYRRMARVSQIRNTHANPWLVMGTLFIFILAGFTWAFSLDAGQGFHWYFSFDNQLPLWFKLLACLTLTRLYMHYYLDRIIFRMRDPLSAKHFGPLLTLPPEADPTSPALNKAV